MNQSPQVMGEWLRTAGESIYGTRAGPLPVAAWGVTTQRPGAAVTRPARSMGAGRAARPP